MDVDKGVVERIPGSQAALPEFQERPACPEQAKRLEGELPLD